jgi:hypothetical protein
MSHIRNNLCRLFLYFSFLLLMLTRELRDVGRAHSITYRACFLFFGKIPKGPDWMGECMESVVSPYNLHTCCLWTINDIVSLHNCPASPVDVKYLPIHLSPGCLGKSSFEFTVWGRFLHLHLMREWYHLLLALHDSPADTTEKRLRTVNLSC